MQSVDETKEHAEAGMQRRHSPNVSAQLPGVAATPTGSPFAGLLLPVRNARLALPPDLAFTFLGEMHGWMYIIFVQTPPAGLCCGLPAALSLTPACTCTARPASGIPAPARHLCAKRSLCEALPSAARATGWGRDRTASRQYSVTTLKELSTSVRGWSSPVECGLKSKPRAVWIAAPQKMPRLEAAPAPQAHARGAAPQAAHATSPPVAAAEDRNASSSSSVRSPVSSIPCNH